MQKLYGLIGFPLGHSFSAEYFNAKFAKLGIAAEFKLFPWQSMEELPALLLQYAHLKGLSVTIPYKLQVIDYLQRIDDAAKAIGAVNCINITHGELTGYNTDVIGFEKSLLPLLQKLHMPTALVLGNGGAAKAVQYVLRKNNIAFTTVSRQALEGCISYEQLNPEIIDRNKLIINTTPLGMHPKVNACPALPYQAIGAQHVLYDLVYNPNETLLLTKGKERGATIQNGLPMLHLQAEAAWEIWNA